MKKTIMKKTIMERNDASRRTRADWALEAVAVASLLAAVASPWFYGGLSADAAVPAHFNAAGEVDAWGGRSAAWTLVVVEAVTWIFLTVVERFPGSFNYPVRLTEANRDVLQRLMVRMVRVLKAEMTVVLTYGQYATVRVATGRAEGLNVWVMATLLVVVAISLIAFVARMVARRRG